MQTDDFNLIHDMLVENGIECSLVLGDRWQSGVYVLNGNSALFKAYPNEDTCKNPDIADPQYINHIKEKIVVCKQAECNGCKYRCHEMQQY